MRAARHARAPSPPAQRSRRCRVPVRVSAHEPCGRRPRSMTVSPASVRAAAASARWQGRLARVPWWPLALLLVAAAAVRLSTISLQSFWYDEAYTPVHVLHPGLGATLQAWLHDENTPPLWYLVAWAASRV